MSKVLTEKFIRLKTAVGGNREVTAYEDTFGMPKEEQAHITRPNQWNTRILSELEFALNLREDGAFDEAIERALDILLKAMKADGVLNNAVCQEAEDALAPLQEEAKSYRLILAAHAHIDMNWMWSYPETVAATLATFRTMLTLMEEYPDFHFSQSQAAVYEIVEKYDSEMMEAIKARIREGRWECTASAWVEADHNMPSTESMLRHIAYTRKYLSEKWGVKNFEIDFSPDTFGHNVSLAEVDVFSGVRYFYHCRGLKEDEILYRYRAPSGRELLTYREPFWYNAAVTPRMGIAVPLISRRCAGLKTGLAIYGVGDHGGGPTRRDIEFAQEMMQWPIFPALHFGTVREFFHAAESVRDQLPVIAHEVNYFAPGCYTTQSRIKQGNRRLEAQLCDTEVLSAAAQKWTGFRPNADGLREAWQKVLFTHFHDILTGSCVQDTREHAMGLYQQSAAMAQSQMSLAMQAICQRIDTSALGSGQNDRRSQSEGAGGGFHVENFGGFPCPERGNGLTRVFQLFNPTAQPRKEVVELTSWDWVGDLKRACVTDAKGRELPFQLVDGQLQKYWDHQYFRFLVQAELPAAGYTTVVLHQRDAERYPVYFQSGERVSALFDDLLLENDRLRAVLDKGTGRIRSLQIDGMELLESSAGFSLVETEPATSNAWQIGRHIRQIPVDQCVDLRWTERGPLRQSVQAKYLIASSTLEVTYLLEEGSDTLRLNVKTDWHEIGGATIPVLFFQAPLKYQPIHFRYDVAAGSVCRESTANDVPGLQYGLAAREHGAGLMMMSDCKYGYRGEGSSLGLTLLNSSTSPDPYPERGIHQFAIGLTACTDHPAMAENKATAFCRSIQYQSNGIHAGTLPTEKQLVTLNAENVVLSAVWMEKKELRIRLYETGGEESTSTLVFDGNVVSAEACDGLGQCLPANVQVTDNRVSFTIPAFQLMEIRAVLA